jgi:molybdopterin synthase catalytic subunit
LEKSHFISSISEMPIPEFEAGLDPSTTHGADLRFHGVVRDREDGQVITGIDYSAYRPMADNELQAVIDAMSAEHPDHRVAIHHRLGFVPAGEASILIRVQTAHSAAAFDLCREYLRRIKTSVPIWKAPIFQEIAT